MSVTFWSLMCIFNELPYSSLNLYEIFTQKIFQLSFKKIGKIFLSLVIWTDRWTDGQMDGCQQWQKPFGLWAKTNPSWLPSVTASIQFNTLHTEGYSRTQISSITSTNCCLYWSNYCLPLLRINNDAKSRSIHYQTQAVDHNVYMCPLCN